MTDVSPTARQRELGLRLRELRAARNLTVEIVAKELHCSPTKIARAETGVRRATLRDVRDLCRIYEVDPETSAELMELAKDAYQPGWWTKGHCPEDRGKDPRRASSGPHGAATEVF